MKKILDIIFSENTEFLIRWTFGMVTAGFLLFIMYGCAASVSTEQYVGEYEKQKSLDEVEVTKVDGLKLYDLKFNKELEERYPELAEKRVSMGLVQELQNVISYIGRFNLIEAERDMQLLILNDLKANNAKIEKASSGYLSSNSLLNFKS